MSRKKIEHWDGRKRRIFLLVALLLAVVGIASGIASSAPGSPRQEISEAQGRAGTDAFFAQYAKWIESRAVQDLIPDVLTHPERYRREMIAQVDPGGRDLAEAMSKAELIVAGPVIRVQLSSVGTEVTIASEKVVRGQPDKEIAFLIPVLLQPSPDWASVILAEPYGFRTPQIGARVAVMVRSSPGRKVLETVGSGGYVLFSEGRAIIESEDPVTGGLRGASEEVVLAQWRSVR